MSLALAREADVSQPSILFVCLGNICRSPMAEGAMRAELLRRGLDWEVDSAGTAAYHVGNPPDPRAIACAAENGADISGLRARQAVPNDFHRFTHIFALDDKNLANLRAIRPGDGSAELGLVLDMIEGRKGETVADPYYAGDDAFDFTWRVVTEAASAIADKLSR
ncbi:low molecular weight protein-tyrosine-phosphatase [Blastomonas marina]|nr:low molecular weight protein-tyrosine-phosphatase [Blastomonas marina]